MRKFALENSRGEVMELNNDDQFFHNPDGLGYGSDSIKGTITFTDNNKMGAYDRYSRFARFIQHTPLTLYYVTDSIYKIDVTPTEISKTELGDLGLSVDIELERLSKFYREYSEGNLSDSMSISIPVRSDSVVESGIILSMKIWADASSLEWTHTVDSEPVLMGRIEYDFLEGDIITVNTTESPYSITLTRDGATTDIYSHSDFSTDRFPLLQFGHNVFSALSMRDIFSRPATVSVKGRIEYETV